MRYIGNKRKLIPFIASALDRFALSAGTACDPFAGTASVARHLKSRGFRVASGDILSFSYVLQRAYVVVDRAPRFPGLRDLLTDGEEPLAGVIRHLNRLHPEPGFITEEFSPSDRGSGRRYFTPENAAAIDAVRRRIWEWNRDGRLTADEHYVLLASLLEAADRVANTTGVYAAYVKTWQPNATRALRLRVPRLTLRTGLACRAYQCDAVELLTRLPPVDLLYLDPPYNTRQYAGYYHIPEIISEGWFDRRPRLRGKTGLPAADGKRSDWSRRRRCQTAFRSLLATARARHILMSYNSEGILPGELIEETLRDVGKPGTYRRLERAYKRYRSDRDSAERRYSGDRVTERLHYVELA